MKTQHKISILGILILILLGAATPIHANLILNGSFETGPALDYEPGLWANVPAGATSITNWTVIMSDIDYKGTAFWEASDGDRSLDLNGSNGAGGIEQTFDTIIGREYDVAFDMAGNTSDNPLNVTPIKWMRVAAAGDSQDFSFDVSSTTYADMGWETKYWSFTATDTSTTLQFMSLDPTMTYGPTLDNVQVLRVIVPEPATIFMLGIGGISLLIRRRRG